MQPLNDIIFLLAVLAVAICLTGIIEGVREDNEKRYWKRRDEGYQRHKARLKKERLMGENRMQLWKAVNK